MRTASATASPAGGLVRRCGRRGETAVFGRGAAAPEAGAHTHAEGVAKCEGMPQAAWAAAGTGVRSSCGCTPLLSAPRLTTACTPSPQLQCLPVPAVLAVLHLGITARACLCAPLKTCVGTAWPSTAGQRLPSLSNVPPRPHCGQPAAGIRACVRPALGVGVSPPPPPPCLPALRARSGAEFRPEGQGGGGLGAWRQRVGGVGWERSHRSGSAQ